VRRREFITLIGGAAAVWPLAARAQQPSKLPTIGILGTSTPTAWSLWVPAFTQRIRELGWIEGRTVALEYRWAENRSERAVEIAAEFVRLKVDVIVTTGNAVLEARQATSVIPIVFAAANDPVESGLVASLARPGGNVTGLSNQAVDLAGKRLGLLREILPAVRRLGIMANVGYRATALEIDRLQSAARALGVEGTVLEITRAEDIPPAIDALKGRAEALYVIGDSLTTANRVQIGSLAMAKRLPTMSTGREFVEAGALISYGPNFPDLFRRTADYVDKILRGTRPGEIPVEQPTRFDLVLNLKTAKGLDLDVPMHLQQLADGVIE
jgi:putative tryptophan/tyrosine transport system substrate-binding protein